LDDLVAQLVEQYTFNVWALGSSPSQITKELSNELLFYFMPYMYILYSTKLNKYYVGACIDLDRRLYEHNIGHSKFTALGIPWQLKYTEDFSTLQLAKKRELEIKKKKSRIYIENLIGSSVG
jgi:putative endonuclease